MSHQIDPVQVGTFAVVFLLITGAGFLASVWRRSGKQDLEQWGLGGRQFGTLMTWFLVGGDFYTAYTMIAIPALVYSTGGAGFFALPYTILVYPFVFVTMPRLWEICRTHHLITPADFVRWRYQHAGLALAVAVTGIVALMPYIALQLAGIRGLLEELGLTGRSVWAHQAPITVSFLFLAVYTYTSGLRAPALLAFAKDVMIYIVVLAAVIVIPVHLGGYGAVMQTASQAYKGLHTSARLVPSLAGGSAYASLALGSALAAFLYPHTVTSVLASSSGNVIRRNAVLLPAYTLLLGLIALLGIAARAAHLHLSDPERTIPALFSVIFPAWMSGFAFAAIAIAALVPSAIMAIAAANLFTRNIYREYLRSAASDAKQTEVARLASVFVTLGALCFVLGLPAQYAVNMQLLGGAWILQTLPAIIFGLWPIPLRPRAVLLGWFAGMLVSTLLIASQHARSPVFPLSLMGHPVPLYIGLLGLMANLLSLALFQRLTGRDHNEAGRASVCDEVRALFESGL